MDYGRLRRFYRRIRTSRGNGTPDGGGRLRRGDGFLQSLHKWIIIICIRKDVGSVFSSNRIFEGRRHLKGADLTREEAGESLLQTALRARNRIEEENRRRGMDV